MVCPAVGGRVQGEGAPWSQYRVLGDLAAPASVQTALGRCLQRQDDSFSP